MRFLYLVLYFSIPYAFRIYFKRARTVNSPKDFFGRTIYVSNHPASFMDPLVVASMRSPIVFFMTRSDVFTTLSKPFLWMTHMLPIYRQQDGVNTKDKNKETFNKAAKVLFGGRNLLIFGEGFTDDVFIRRLKPLKKGAARIGFGTLEAINWKKNIYIAAVGANYTDPNLMRSEVLVSSSEKICLNDFKDEYLENPNKVIHDITKQIEKMLQDQITHVEDVQLATFHEQIMMISRKGMNAYSNDSSIPLEERWAYSRKLALWLNSLTELDTDLALLKDKLEGYFSLIKKKKLKDSLVSEKARNGGISRSFDVLKIILLFPFSILGFIHCGIPYILIKRFVEKSFKRKVFWGSTKLIMAVIGMGLINIPAIFLFHAFVYPSWWMSIGYYLLIGYFGLAAYEWTLSLLNFREKGIVSKIPMEGIVELRIELQKEIERIIPI